MPTEQGKTKRLRAGVYHYTLNGRTFKLEEVGISEGFKKRRWNVSEVTEGRAKPAFDASDTLAEAKYWARCAVEQP